MTDPKDEFAQRWSAQAKRWAEAHADLAEQSEALAELSLEAAQHIPPGEYHELIEGFAGLLRATAATARQDALDGGEFAARVRSALE